jgi:hypothetical protein
MENTNRKGKMNEPLELEDIAGMSLSITGTLVESYIKNGYADPLMYKALRASAELATHFAERVRINGGDTELLEGVTQLIADLRLTAMECGEVVNSIIDEHGLPVDKNSWSQVTTDCDCGEEHGEE